MEVLIVISKIEIKANGFNRVWQTFLSTDDENCMPIEAKEDLEKEGISFTVKNVEVKESTNI
tara:strand:- start:551 stop:736 length:186 start_codon:yes stop_codon:yes gene_type:complete